MKEEKMLENIGQINEKFIEEAAPKGLLEGNEKNAVSKRTKMYRFTKWGALAACLCLVVGVSIMALEPKDEINSNNNMNSDIQEEQNNIDTSIKDYFNSVDSTTNDTEFIYSGDKGFLDLGIKMSAKNVTPSGLTLVITLSGETSAEGFMTGEPYRLLTLVDGTWQAVEELPLPEGVDGRGFNSIGYWINKGETREFDINWEWIYGELPSGVYCLKKEFLDITDAGNYESFTCSEVFEIR